jgi:hypothetical protein
MASDDPLPLPQVNDTVAAAVEAHLASMQGAGYGKLSISQEPGGFALSFGPVSVRGETYEVALLRLAGALLDHADFAGAFLERLRKPPRLNLRDNQFKSGTTAGGQ